MRIQKIIEQKIVSSGTKTHGLEAASLV